jgi:hypothetical protein
MLPVLKTYTGYYSLIYIHVIHDKYSYDRYLSKEYVCCNRKNLNVFLKSRYVLYIF